MLSPKEKRFELYWEDQRTGGKWHYLLLYTFCLTFIVFVAPVLLGLFLSVFSFLHLDRLSLLGLALVVASICFAGSYYAWEKNEKKWKSVLEKAASPGPST
jgi:NADH:ubiquinone oxidoreductase subunit 3 (subunit A)